MKVDFNDKTVGGFHYELIRGLSVQSAGAAEFGECMEAMAQVRDNDFESWTAAWTRTADRTAAYAQRQLARGDGLAARGAFLRASNYYRMAAFYAHHEDPRHRELWGKGKETFSRMAGLLAPDRRIETVRIPFEGASLPGYFMPCGRDGRPTLIAIGGFDSTKEEVYCWIGAAARDYGFNCLVFEGPGQWGALMENPGLVFRPDYEKPVGAAVDYLEARGDVDKGKVALIGYSMGGYLCMRGALDPRVKACIPNTLIVDCGAAAKAGMKNMVKGDAFVDKAFGLLMRFNTPARWGFQHSSWVLGIRTPSEWVKAYEGYTLLGFEGALRGKPLLLLFSEDDIVDAAAPSPAIVSGLLDYIASLDCDRYARLFTRQEGASSHCQMGGLSYAHAAVFGWLGHVFDGKPLATNGDPAMRERFVALFRRHGGKGAGEKAESLLRDVAFVD
jgi:pimeloyl-ACP methyl ester carboxylesterase